MENTTKVALITGATRGIGKQIALELAENGYNISLNYRTLSDEVNNLKSEIESKGVKCLLVNGDVSDFESCENMAKETVQSLGQIDVLVNNAGITKDGLLMRMKKEDFTKVIDINLVGTFNMTRNVIPFMIKKRSGRIINVSSVVGITGNAGQTNYSASKAGVIGFTKSLAKEVASRNILVNAIAPGFIATDMTAALPEEQQKALAAQIPLGQLGKPADIAHAVAFLASEGAGYITGHELHVNGGMYM